MPTSALVNAERIREPREYRTSLFVSRNVELDTVKERIKSVQRKEILSEPIVNFWGIKGIGKTWLLQHLHHLYQYSAANASTISSTEKQTLAVLYAFPDKATTISLHDVAYSLAEQTLKQLGMLVLANEQQLLLKAQQVGSIESLAQALHSLSSRFIPLLLVDNVESMLQANWESLERLLIEPLVSSGQVVVVVAGRRQVLQWRRFEVRRRVVEAEKSSIHPFNQQDVIRQLQHYPHPIPAYLVFPYTGGSPQLVDAIAEHIQSWIQGAQDVELDQVWFDKRRPAFLQILQTSEGQFLEDIPIDLRLVLNAVSPLRFYRLEALRVMLARAETSAEPRPDGYYLNLLRALDQQTDVVRWDRGRRAYVTDQVVRQLVNRRQLLEDRDDYVARHQRALDMYWRWVRDYPEFGEDFIVEIWFHLANLYAALQDTNALREAAWDALYFAANRLNADRFMILPQQLGSDRELLDLLPSDLRAELLRDLNHLLDARRKPDIPALLVGRISHPQFGNQPRLNISNRDIRVTPPQWRSEDNQDIVAPRTATIVGRTEHIQAIHAAIDDRSGKSHVLFFVALGGIGKTRLLEEVDAIHKAWDGESFRYTQIIDLYHADYHSPGRLRQALIDQLDPDKRYFQRSRVLHDDFEQKLQDGFSAHELEQLRRQLDPIFRDEYTALAQEYRLVIRIDTLELIQYESDVVQEICRVEDMDVAIKTWLLENLRSMPNTVALLAGRPHTKTLEDFTRNFDHDSSVFTLIQLDTFTHDETRAYLQAMYAQRPRLPEVMEPTTQDQIFQVTGGKPIYLALVIDLMLQDEPLTNILPANVLKTPGADSADVGRQLVEHLLRLPEPYGTIITWMLHARKGLNADLLRYLMGDTWSEEKIQQSLDSMSQFAIVKLRPGTDHLFLHDEIYDLYDLYFQKYTLDRLEYKIIGDYYEKQLRELDNSSYREDLIITTLYYKLYSDLKDGFYKYYARWNEDAIKSHETGLDMRLRDEILRFLGRYADSTSRFYNKEIADRVDQADIDRDSALRWIKRYLAQGDPEKTREVAKALRESTDPLFCWDMVDDLFYKAGLLTILGDAMIDTNTTEEEVRAMLEEAIALLKDYQGVDENEIWWRARILGRAHNNLGYLYRIHGHYGMALQHYKHALPLFNEAKIQDELGDTLNNLAFLMGLLGRANLALVHAQQSLEIRKQAGRRYPLALSFNTRGLIYTFQKRAELGERDCREALRICEEIDEVRGIGLACNALGFVLRKRGDQWQEDGCSAQQATEFFEEARQKFEQAAHIFVERAQAITPGHVFEPIRLWEALNELGSLLCDQGWLIRYRKDVRQTTELYQSVLELYHQSIKYQKRALEIARQYNKPFLILNSYDDLARVYSDRSFLLLQMGRTDEARADQERAERYLNTIEGMVPDTFKLMPGKGFPNPPEPGETFLLAMGKAYQWRGTWAFRNLEEQQAPGEMRDQKLEQAIEYSAVAAVYFQHYWQQSFVLERMLNRFGRHLQRAGVSSDYALARLQTIAEKYNVNLDTAKQVVEDVLGV